MYHLNIFAISSLIAADIYLFLALYVWLRQRRALTNQLFSLVGLTMFFWGLGEGMMRASADGKTAMFWATFVIGLGSAFHPAVLLHFWLVFTDKVRSIRQYPIILVIYLPAAIFFSIRFLQPTLFIRQLSLHYWGYSIEGTQLYLGYMLYVAGYTALVAVLTLRTAAKTRGDLSHQARNIGLGILFCLVIGVITQLSHPLLALPLPELSVISTIIFVSLIAFAVSKYGLMVLTTQLVADNMIATMKDYVLAIDPTGQIALANQSLLTDLGYQEDELRTKTLNSVLADDPGKLPFTELRQKMPLTNYPSELVSKTGERVPVSINASLATGESQEIAGIVLVLRDTRQVNDLINGLRQKTNELEISKSQLERNIGELERFNKMVIDREIKMVELKKRIAELEANHDTTIKGTSIGNEDQG
jgi:PAS domain S-box-containing protein